MKQGTFFTKIIFVVLLAALLAYVVFSACSTLQSGITTTTALAYEAGEGMTTTGLVVRDETLIHSDFGINVLTRAEGEKVSAGSTVAVTYEDSGAQELQSQITALEEQLAQLQYVYESSSSKMDKNALDDEILADILQCATYTTRDNLIAVPVPASQIKSQVLRRYLDVENITELQSRINQLNSELTALRRQVSTGTSVLTADCAGFFSGAVDGYETLLSSQALESMTIGQYNDLYQQQIQPPTTAIGKLVTSSVWYYVTLVDAEQVEGLEKGDRVTVTLSHNFQEPLRMSVWRLSNETDGKRLLVLSCNDYITEATGLRDQAADIVTHSYAGLRVPKQAIYYSEEAGSAGVYVLEGSNAVWKNVEILHDLGESYIVREDKSSIDNLWPGDEIIITSQELFDGKVVS